MKESVSVRLPKDGGAFAKPLFGHGKANISYSECMFVALVILHSKRMRRNVLLSVSCPTLPYSSTLRHWARNVFCFSPQLFVWNIPHFKTKSARYCHKYKNVFVQSTRYRCQILMQFEFCRYILGGKKKLEYQILWKSVKFEPSCSVRMEERTWRS
jgi:hypothetical protein